MNNTTRTLKPTQMVQSVSRNLAAAAFYPEDPDEPRTTRLRDGSSSRKNCIVYTDSFSALESLRGKSYRAKNVKRFYNLLKIIATASPGGHGMDSLTCGHFWKRKTKELMDLQKQHRHRA